MSRKDSLLVVAIDFGTTYSGYAIQFKHEYDPKDPTKIRAPQCWNGGKQNLMSYKTPTCLLLNSGENILSFGYEAEELYAEMCMNGEHKTHYFYRRFKMKLQEGVGLKKDTQIEDETGKGMPAIQVFALSIKCLKDKLEEMLNNEGTGVVKGDVQWVLTVPAIWDDAAKGFMKEAAKKAGIKEQYLSIALEPEAASLFCQFLPVEKLCDAKKNAFSSAAAGTTYMVVDLGGGTADITVHEKLQDHKVKEVYKASGGPWGGTAVDNAFMQFLISIASGPVMSKFQKHQTYDHLDLLKEFECIKRTLGTKTGEWYTIKFPASLNEICKEQTGDVFKDLVAQSKYKDKISFVGDKMRMKTALVEDMFKTVTDKIVEHIKDIMKQVSKQVTLMLLVGGFSDSPFVQKVIKAGVPSSMKVLIPQQAGLSVLNGAVVFGRLPDSITTRILRYTYGVEVYRDFKEGEDSESRRCSINKNKCQGGFSPFIEEGTSVEAGHKVIKVYATVIPNQPGMEVAVYTAKGKVPKYINESNCNLLGTYTVKVPNPSPEKHNLVTMFSFGNTTLAMTAIEDESKKVCTTEFALQE